MLTKADGSVAQTYDYLPFGQEFTPSGDTNRIRFTSKERDAETGLDWFESRYYSSAQGRFTSPDEFKGGFLDAFTGQAAFQAGPLPYADIGDPQTLNKYAYVRNNPLRYPDPNGHCFWDACVGETLVTYTVATAVAAGAIYYSQRLGEAIGNYFAAKRADNTSESSKTSPDTKNPASVSPLPANPSDLVDQGYHDVSHPEAAAAGHQTLEHPETGDRVRFDKGKPGAPGHEGTDHYHRDNPNATGKKDQYLDKDGNPVPRGSDASHLKPSQAPPPTPKKPDTPGNN